MTRATLACAAILSAAVPAPAQDQASFDALARWAEAVEKHAPGAPDGAASRVAAWSYANRRELNPAMEALFAALRGERPALRTLAPREIADALRSDAGVSAFLRRAAILHTDAGIFADDLPQPPDDAPAAPLVDARTGARSMRLGDVASPLLSSDRYVLSLDGRVVGEAPANWNWAFARSLVDLLLSIRPLRATDARAVADRAFAAEWYHAVAAYMLANRNHGDLRRHLERAARALPDDPRALFDRACYAEALGLPSAQALPDDPGYWTSGGRFIDLPTEGAANSDAERLFRRTLEVDPSYVEARVRLARLLDHRGRHDEASREIGDALARSPDGVVGFYAHIVAGRLASAHGSYDASQQYYRDALSRFPRAQSASLGASHAALMAADVAGALASLEPLGAAQGSDADDPWWAYELGPGRDADALIAALWIATSALPRQP